MKVTMFHFMPYRDLPADFPPKGLASSWVDAPWWEYGDADKVTDYYNWSLDELDYQGLRSRAPGRTAGDCQSAGSEIPRLISCDGSSARNGIPDRSRITRRSLALVVVGTLGPTES
jgi:hypothetical protein